LRSLRRSGNGFCSVLEAMAKLEVYRALDGLEPFQKTGEFQPYLILFEVALPGLNGIEPAKRALRLARNAKPLFCWPRVSPDVVRETFLRGLAGLRSRASRAERGCLFALKAVRFTRRAPRSLLFRIVNCCWAENAAPPGGDLSLTSLRGSESQDSSDRQTTTNLSTISASERVSKLFRPGGSSDLP
jgi:DNA-binding NarL/FixJ family response regulator